MGKGNRSDTVFCTHKNIYTVWQFFGVKTGFVPACSIHVELQPIILSIFCPDTVRRTCPYRSAKPAGHPKGTPPVAGA